MSIAEVSRSSRPKLFTPPFVRLLLVQLLFGTAFSTLFVLPRYLIEALHAEPWVVGNGHGAFALSGVLVVPWLGRALERFGNKPVLLAGLVLGCLSYGPFGLVHGALALLALRAIHGLAFALVFTAGAAAAIELAPAARRAEAVGYFGTAMLCTNAVGPPIAEFVVTRASWTLAFALCSVYCALALIPAWGVPSRARPGPSSSGYGVPVSRLLVAGYLASVAIGIGVGTTKAFVPAVIVSETAGVVSPYFVGYTVGALVQRSVFGWVPDRLGRARTTTAALAVYACSLAAIALAPASWIPVLGVVHGLAHGAAYPAATAFTADAALPAELGRVTAWMTGFYNLGLTLASSGFAPLQTALGYRGLIALGAVALLLVCIAFAGLVGRAVLRRDVGRVSPSNSA